MRPCQSMSRPFFPRTRRDMLQTRRNTIQTRSAFSACPDIGTRIRRRRVRHMSCVSRVCPAIRDTAGPGVSAP